MDKKKMTKKGTHIVKRLLAVVCCAAMMLGLVPGNLGTMSVQAEDTTIKLSEISTDANNPTQLSVGATIDTGGADLTVLKVYGSKDQSDNASSQIISSGYEIKDSYDSYTTDYKWEAYCTSNQKTYTIFMWPAADTRTETTTTLSAESITVTEGDTWTLTAQAKASGTNIDGATVVYYTNSYCSKKLDAIPTTAGKYYARGEYAGNDTYKPSNSEVIPIYIYATIDTKMQINAPDLVVGQTYKAGMQIVNAFEGGVAFTGYEDFKKYGVDGDSLYILKAYLRLDSNDTLPTSGSYTSRKFPYGPNNEETEIGADEWIYGGYGGGIGYFFYAPKYTVSLTNASSDVSLCYVRTSVTITADAAPEGKELSGWTGLDGITITSGSASTETVTFTMPASNVSITANYNDKGTAPTDPTTPTEKENVAKVGDSDNSGTLTVKSDIDSSAPKTTVATKASDIVNILKQDETLTADEIKDINDGNSDVEVILGVKDNKDSISTASKDLIKEKADAEGMTIAEYMDITLTKYIIPSGKTRADVSGTKIEKLTNGSIAITVTIPDGFKNTDASKTRTYYILRNHDNAVSVLNGTLSSDGNEFTFTTDKFSDYVLTYKDTAKPASNPSNGNAGSTTSTASATTTSTVTTNTTTIPDGDSTTAVAENNATSPKTGENNMISWMFVLLLASTASALALKAHRRKEM